MIDRLSTLDAEFLHVEDDTSPMHIAVCCVFAGPAPTLGDLCRSVESKLDALPRYRQVVRRVPFELGRPVWVDDAHFRVDHHLHRIALPVPGDDAELDQLMGVLMAHRLDRNRPLWKAWLVEGLSDGRWALVCKVHHCMVDGIAGVHLLEALLDTTPTDTPGSVTRWSPSPLPSSLELVAGSWVGLGADLVPWARRASRLVTSPLDSARSTYRFGVGVVRFLAHLGPIGPSDVQGRIGPHRSWSHVTLPLGDVKRVRQRLGGTVNDVLLSCVTAGLRELLVAHGVNPAGTVIRTVIPVSTRGWDPERDDGNRVSALIAELPVSIDEPTERLTAIRRITAELKSSGMAEAADIVTSLGDLAPPAVVGGVSRLAIRLEHRIAQRSISTCVTNVPGPQFPLYCLGRELLEQLPYLGLTDGVRVTTAIVSYNGRISVGVTGDEDSVPDVDVVTTAIRSELDALVRASRRRKRIEP